MEQNDKNIHQNNGIWNISDEVLNQAQNRENLENELNNEADLNEVDMYSLFDQEPIKGFIINRDGKIVSVFSHEGDVVEEEENGEKVQKVLFKISKNGFMSKAYTDEGLNVIMGYGHPLKILGLIDMSVEPQKVKLSKQLLDKEDDDIIFKIVMDDLLKERGFNLFIRVEDVIPENLDDEVRELFFENVKAIENEEIESKNNLEESFEAYIKKLYMILEEDEEEFGDFEVEEEKEIK